MSTAVVAPVAPPVTVRSVSIPDPGSLLGLLPAEGALAWVRRGEGLVAWGEAARAEFTGPERFSRAQRWWSAFVADAAVDDTVGIPGSGPVAFASFAFDSQPGRSVVVVPRVVVGVRDGRGHVCGAGVVRRRAVAHRTRRRRTLVRTSRCAALRAD